MKSLIFSRTKFFRILFGLLILGFSFGCQKDLLNTGNTSVPESVTTTMASVKPVNFMVITKSETLPADFEKKITSYGKIINSIPEIGVLVVSPKVSSFELKVSKLTEVKAVVPDLVTRWIEPGEFVASSNPPSIGDNEGYFRLQWGMDAINAPEAWNAGYTGEGAKVFILDSGIDAEHPDLAPNLLPSLCKSFVPSEDWNVEQIPFFNHGSHVAGIIAGADNSYGIIGVAPHAGIVAVKVLTEKEGSGSFSWINAGIVYAANNGANVINMSLGAWFDRNGFYYDEDNVLQKIPAVFIQNLILSQQRAVTYAYKKGVTVIVSAGNDAINADGNKSVIIVPADLQHVVAVSATAPEYWFSSWKSGAPDPAFSAFDVPSSYTNYGRSLVKLAAPGGDFDFNPSTGWFYDMVISCGSQGYWFAAGTSMAAPHVAGVAALIIAKNNWEMSPLDVAQKLFDTADKIDGSGVSLYYGNGRVNAFRAVTE